MTDQAKRPSEIERDSLRGWLRAHPGCTRQEMLNTTGLENVGRMTKAQLREMVAQLGADADTIVADAMRGNLTLPQPAQKVPASVLDTPQDPAVTATLLNAMDKAAVADRVEALKHALVEGGFAAVRTEIADLIEKAAKPSIIKTVEKIVFLPAPEVLPAGVHALKPARSATWHELFNFPAGTVAGDKTLTVWDHPAAPKVNPAYVFPQAATAIALSQMARGEMSRSKGGPGKNILFTGPAGTGKSAWAREFAARTGRPFAVLSLSDGIEMDQLVGQMVLDGKGGTRWQDGLLLAAMRQPGCVICLDEVGGMRPAVGVALNGLLQDLAYYVPDTGERVAVASKVIFVATNNGSLADSGASKGYVGVQRQNRAFADRFGVSIEIGYAAADVEAGLLQTYTGCTAELATLLVSVATLSRQKAVQGIVTHGLGFRRLLAWAETLTDGVPAEDAFRAAVLNTCPEVDQETMRQLALVAIDPAAINAALRGKKAKVLGRGGADFTDTTDGEG